MYSKDRSSFSLSNAVLTSSMLAALTAAVFSFSAGQLLNAIQDSSQTVDLNFSSVTWWSKVRLQFEKTAQEPAVVVAAKTATIEAGTSAPQKKTAYVRRHAAKKKVLSKKTISAKKIVLRSQQETLPTSMPRLASAEDRLEMQGIHLMLRARLVAAVRDAGKVPSTQLVASGQAEVSSQAVVGAQAKVVTKNVRMGKRKSANRPGPGKNPNPTALALAPAVEHTKETQGQSIESSPASQIEVQGPRPITDRIVESQASPRDNPQALNSDVALADGSVDRVTSSADAAPAVTESPPEQVNTQILDEQKQAFADIVPQLSRQDVINQSDTPVLVPDEPVLPQVNTQLAESSNPTSTADDSAVDTQSPGPVGTEYSSRSAPLAQIQPKPPVFYTRAPKKRIKKPHAPVEPPSDLTPETDAEKLAGLMAKLQSNGSRADLNTLIAAFEESKPEAKKVTLKAVEPQSAPATISVVEAFDPSFAVSGAETEIVAHQGKAGATGSKWIQAAAPGYLPTLAYAQPGTKIELVSNSSILLLSRQAKVKMDPNLGAVLGTVPAGYRARLSANAQAQLQLSANGKFVSESDVSEDRYFVLLNADRGAHLLELLNEQGEPIAAVPAPVLPGTVTQVTLQKPSFVPLAGHVLDATTPLLAPLKGIGIHVVGQKQITAQSEQNGSFRLARVAVVGHHPVLVQTTAQQGYTYRYEIQPHGGTPLKLFRFQEAYVDQLLAQLDAGNVASQADAALDPDGAMVIAAVPEVVGMPSDGPLLPVVQPLFQEPSTLLAETYTLNEKGHLDENQPITATATTAVSVNVPRGANVLTLQSERGKAGYSQLVLSSPKVINLIAP